MLATFPSSPFSNMTPALTLPLANSELQALEGVIIGLRVWFAVWVVIFSHVRVGQSLLSCQPGLRIQQQHPLQQVYNWMYQDTKHFKADFF